MNDEITINKDVLTVGEDSVVEENSTVVSQSSVVTNSTINNYFDSDGRLMENVTSDELIFEGEFSGLNFTQLTIGKPIKLTGNDVTLTDLAINVYADNVTVDGFKLIQTKDIYAISLDDVSNAVISNSVIDYKYLENKNAMAIYANNVDNFKFLNNVVYYVGNTTGSSFNNAIRVENDGSKKSSNILVEGNVFDIKMPSSAVGYDSNYNSLAYTQGAVFNGCENLTFKGNNLTLEYTSAVGAYDTIHVLSVGNANFQFTDDYDIIYPNVCDNVEISDNMIEANGHSYIYGIFLAANNFKINDNKVILSSDNNYAAGIDVEGPSSEGNVSNNVIDVASQNSAYGVYSYQYSGAIDDVSYYDNFIYLNAYAACGMEVVANNPVISGNLISLTGNHTTGMALNAVDEAVIDNNVVVSAGSNVGNASTGDSLVHPDSIGISVKGNALIKNNDVSSTSTGINLLQGGNINVTDNVIDVDVVGNYSNYAILADDMDDLYITNNNITFNGKTNGNVITNAIRITNSGDANGVVISDNTLDITIPAADVVYAADWSSTVISEGIVIDSSDNLKFENNKIDLKYGEIIGVYDTIYAVDVLNSKNAAVKGNSITGSGNKYIYGIKLTGDNFIIDSNNISMVSNYYANGVDIEGPATGVISNNGIITNAVNSAYPIYSGMNNQPVSVNITGNDMVADAYYVVGVELGGNDALVQDNGIEIKGNHTIGIGAYLDNVIIDNNKISSMASNVGNESIWDNFGTDTTGIKVLKGNATITNNNVQTTGDYAADLSGNNATVKDNYLAAKKAVAGASVIGSDNATVSGNTPSYKIILAAPKVYTEYVNGVLYVVMAMDENGDPLANMTIFTKVNGNIYNETTDANGYAAFVLDLDAGYYVAETSFEGDDKYGPKQITTPINVEASGTVIKSAASSTVLLTAIKTGSYYKIVLLDTNDNWLANKTVSITFNGKTSTYVTDELGVIKYKLSASKVGTQKLTIKFAGDNNYVGSTSTATIKITKQATKVIAVNKVYKVRAKVKYYVMTLKDNKNKVIKKAKVTLRVNGKTYVAVTKANGKAIFKITKLAKKGTFTALVKFAGNGYYNPSLRAVKIRAI